MIDPHALARSAGATAPGAQVVVVRVLAPLVEPALQLLKAVRRAWRAGLRKSDCILRDPRLVMLYLGTLAAAGAGWTFWVLWRRFVPS